MPLRATVAAMKSLFVPLLMLSCLNKARLEKRRDPGYQDARQGDVFWLLRGEESEQIDEAIQFWQDALLEHPASSSLLSLEVIEGNVDVLSCKETH